MFGDEWVPTEDERINQLCKQFRQFGLIIFETFEEYMKDKEESSKQSEY